jgi:hypothetical protein
VNESSNITQADIAQHENCEKKRYEWIT